MNVSVYYKISYTGASPIQDADFNDDYDGVFQCQRSMYEERRFLVNAKTSEEMEKRLKRIWLEEKKRIAGDANQKPCIAAVFRYNCKQCGFFDNERFVWTV